MSAKKNTLLNYFTKVSSNEFKNSKEVGEQSVDVGSHKRKRNSSPKKSPSQDKRKSKVKANKSPKDEVQLTFSAPFKVGDLVWAKLQGYPWWPSLIYTHPTERQFCKWDGSGKCQELHVQFIDKPPSRAWLKEKYVKEFKLNDSTINKPSDLKWHQALKEAEKLTHLSPSDRLTFILSEDFMTNKDVESDSSENETSTNVKSDIKRKDSSLSPEENVRKRLRLVLERLSDGSDEEFKPKESDVESESVSSGVSENSISGSESSVEESQPKKSKGGPNKVKKESQRDNSLVDTPRISEKTKSLLASFSSNDSCSKLCNEVEEKNFGHLRLDFLKPDKIRDANKNAPSHPDYDPKTLYVPDTFKKTLTPALKQWWEVKSQHFDTILFFKVGKFYELYHMDAVIGVNELNLIFMKGDVAHSGFPEIAYGRYSASLVEKGYKVARVEQTETPVMMEERCKKQSHPTKFDRVVRRELCQITSKGTKKFGVLDAQTSESSANYLLAVTEQCFETMAGDESEYGVCFIDTSLGVFHLGQFRDDRHNSRFRTLLSRYPPVQVLYERRCLSSKSLQILKSCVNPKLIESLLPKTQFWDSTQTLRFLAEEIFYKDSENSLVSGKSSNVFKEFLSESDSLGLEAKKEYEMAVKSLGALIWYLKESYLEGELLSMKNFEKYVCMDISDSEKQAENSRWHHFTNRNNMILDGVTLKNLDVLQNAGTGNIEGSLIWKLDHCNSLAGKRLLYQWICTPLVQASAINDRLDAVDDLINNCSVATKAASLLKKLPDLERLLSKIHAVGYSSYNKNHPDNRAIFYEDAVYSKRKICDFIAALDGFRLGHKIIQLFDEIRPSIKSRLLKKIVTLDDDENFGGCFPNFSDKIKCLNESFDQEQAKKDGKIIPSAGVDIDYDNAIEEIKTTKKDLDSYLESQCKLFGCKVTYVGTARNRFQIEVPDRCACKATSKHELQGQRKGFKRYWTPEVKEMLNRMMMAEEKRDSALRLVMAKIFLLFSQDMDSWNLAIQCLATLDVLSSFAHYSQNSGSPMCRPSVVIPSENSIKPFLSIKNGRHPCITNVFGGGEFIPNDTVIGISDSNENESHNLLLITGPNMGGKSTLLRQVGLIVITAQLGCYVPAEECNLTSVDRIFTRLGASDRIMMGESTFFVELSETSATLKHASEHSLILMDELGRGTSTYDGMATAYAVVDYISNSIACRTLFSTHYHHLIQTFNQNPKCKLAHMTCIVENENDEDPTQENITFLYKLGPGACPKSYGFSAAKLAGMCEKIIRVAYKKAKDFEETVDNVKIFRSVCSNQFSREQFLRLFIAKNGQQTAKIVML